MLDQIRKKKKELQESAWLLGICEKGFDDLRNNHVKWISNGEYEGKKWFADPFILNYDDKEIHLLVEEFDYIIHRGRIAKLTIDRKHWIITDCKIILDLDTHLSFPMIWRTEKEIYVCPENYHSGGWNIYRYNSGEEELKFIQQLSAEKLTDATIWYKDDDYWLLSTYEPHPNGQELTIWKSNNLTGPYKETQRVNFNENIGRNAGMIFQYKDMYLRPAQESNLSYGHSLVFQKVELKDHMFVFDEFCRISSPHSQYNIGIHTYNQHHNGMAVIDVKNYRHPYVGRIIKTFGRLLVRLHLKKQYRPE